MNPMKIKDLRIKLCIGALFTALCLIQSITSGQPFEDRRPENLKGTLYSQTGFFTGHQNRSADPYIVEVINQINADSIKSTIQRMQDFGTRFLMLDNRKEIADWLVQKFVSYGYTDVKIDSFLCYINWNNIYVDTNMQYNVITTLQGQSAPAEEYHIGGHYDSFCYGDPYTYAPGANDNATAVAATVEIARIMKQVNYHPEATIRFTLFAAEELGLFGSRSLAQRSYENGADIRFYYNFDMISNNPDSIKEVTIYSYTGIEWASNLAAASMEQYTDLVAYMPVGINTGSDAFSYWLWGFPTTYVEERNFSPHWHQPSDTVGNCNIEYCAEITKGACALLIEEQILPYPQRVFASSSEQGISISWAPMQNANVAGFNLYRSIQQGTGYEKANSSLITGTSYLDQVLIAGVNYYYILTVVNNAQEESLPSPEVNGARFAFSDTLLVINALPGTNLTPDSISQFYNYILDDIPYEWKDINQELTLTLGDLAMHRNILWVVNSSNYPLNMRPSYPDMINYFQNGGHMMVSAFNPCKLLENVTTYPLIYPEGSLMYDYFKIDSIDRNITSMMFQAYPVSSDYDTLRIDPDKSTTQAFPGQIHNVDIFLPAPGGHLIYRFDSYYPPDTPLGESQDYPVGIEYMGEDFKTLLLSFPLYYLDTMDAKEFLHLVMYQKFDIPTGIAGPDETVAANSLKCYPNPLQDMATIEFNLEKSEMVNLSVYNMQGSLIEVLINVSADKGQHHYSFSSESLPSGIYQVVLKTSSNIYSRKIVIL
jgi:hypothetical protein